MEAQNTRDKGYMLKCIVCQQFKYSSKKADGSSEAENAWTKMGINGNILRR